MELATITTSSKEDPQLESPCSLRALRGSLVRSCCDSCCAPVGRSAYLRRLRPGGHVLRKLRVVVPVLLLAASACAHGGRSEAADPAGGSVEVAVSNQNALPMEVSASGSGITHRMGTVYPGMSSHFTLPQNLVGNGSVQFEARPSGGGQPFRSGDILLAPGTLVQFQIAAQLFNSTVTRRP
jgi:hypothetical protein